MSALAGDLENEDVREGYPFVLAKLFNRSRDDILVLKSPRGRDGSVLGWTFWEVRLPGQGGWTRLKSLRSRGTRAEARKTAGYDVFGGM